MSHSGSAEALTFPDSTPTTTPEANPLGLLDAYEYDDDLKTTQSKIRLSITGLLLQLLPGMPQDRVTITYLDHGTAKPLAELLAPDSAPPPCPSSILKHNHPATTYRSDSHFQTPAEKNGPLKSLAKCLARLFRK